MAKKVIETDKGKAIIPSIVQAPIVHAPDFISRYANTIRFEATVYDLKLVFGESDLGGGVEKIQQHTAITIPWALVKIGMYWLQANVEIHEAINGKVSIPPSQIPPVPSPVPPDLANDANAKTAYDIAVRIREEFVAGL